MGQIPNILSNTSDTTTEVNEALGVTSKRGLTYEVFVRIMCCYSPDPFYVLLAVEEKNRK